jgi:hypothetical protein
MMFGPLVIALCGPATKALLRAIAQWLDRDTMRVVALVAIAAYLVGVVTSILVLLRHANR